MNHIINIYNKIESNIQLLIRAGLVLAVFTVLIYTLFAGLTGYFMSKNEANLRSGASGAEYNSIQELIFKKQERVAQYVEDEEEEEVEKVFDPKIISIRSAMRVHFDDKKAQREQFDEALDIESLDSILRSITSGQYKLGSISRSAYPRDAECSSSQTFPTITNHREVVSDKNEIARLINQGFTKEDIDEVNNKTIAEEKEYQRFLSQLEGFWNDAKPAPNEKSKFESLTSFRERLATVWAANDLFLCGWIQSQDDINEANQIAKQEAAKTRSEGSSRMIRAGAAFIGVFTFLATLAMVLVALVLSRIERLLKDK